MLPAFKKENFNLFVDNDKLTVEGERTLNEETKYNTKQSYFGSIKRTYTLPNFVDANKIKSEYVDGVLNITIPKLKEKITKKTIEIK